LAKTAAPPSTRVSPSISFLLLCSVASSSLYSLKGSIRPLTSSPEVFRPSWIHLSHSITPSEPGRPSTLVPSVSSLTLQRLVNYIFSPVNEPARHSMRKDLGGGLLTIRQKLKSTVTHYSPRSKRPCSGRTRVVAARRRARWREDSGSGLTRRGERGTNKKRSTAERSTRSGKD